MNPLLRFVWVWLEEERRGRGVRSGADLNRSAVALHPEITEPLRPATMSNEEAGPPGLEPGLARLELAVLPVTPRACERTRSLRQDSNPHLGRTKGACLPLTLRRRERVETAGVEPAPPRCERGALPLELHPRAATGRRVAGRARTGACGAHNPGCFRYTTATTRR